MCGLGAGPVPKHGVLDGGGDVELRPGRTGKAQTSIAAGEGKDRPFNILYCAWAMDREPAGF